MIDGVRYQALSLTIVSPGLTADCVAEGPAACLAIRWWVEGTFHLGDEALQGRQAFLQTERRIESTGVPVRG